MGSHILIITNLDVKTLQRICNILQYHLESNLGGAKFG
jgi:hypothetical protein